MLGDMAEPEVVTLGGGCFWCLEAVYERMEGVAGVESGYMGGHVRAPSYEDVCTGRTGHVEVVRVTFDPEAAGLREILEVFFTIHDPTTPGRQGADVGPQYRSAIFYHTERQRRTAEELIRELDAEGIWDAPIATEVRPAEEFYPAEDYHQRYYANNPNKPYCMFVVAPKLRKFREKFAQRFRE
jgi:peptide-methionine (S)-S-oxide reductase